MTRTRVTPFLEHNSMMLVLSMVVEEGYWAKPGRTAKYPHCVVTEVDGGKFLRSKGFKPSVVQSVEVMDYEDGDDR
jgi:hypothetical protein